MIKKKTKKLPNENELVTSETFPPIDFHLGLNIPINYTNVAHAFSDTKFNLWAQCC